MYLRAHIDIVIFDEALRQCFQKKIAHSKKIRNKNCQKIRRTFHTYAHCNTLCFAKVSLSFIDHSPFSVSSFSRSTNFLLPKELAEVTRVILSARAGSFILRKLCLTLHENIWPVSRSMLTRDYDRAISCRSRSCQQSPWNLRISRIIFDIFDRWRRLSIDIIELFGYTLK